MARFSARFWFVISVAVLAAAAADPLLERASNLGWFGPGNYTDHSNWDVVPTLLVGALFALFYLCLRVREMLLGSLTAVQIARLLPAIFVLQVVALFAMETTEQYVVYGRFLGGTIWLGAPLAISLTTHAVACILTTVCVSALLRALSQAALRFVRFACEVVTLLHDARERALDRYVQPELHRYAAPVPRTIGERGPPTLILA